MSTNPATIPISGDSTGSISCQANAAYYQRVTLTWTILRSTTTVVFTGSGEGVAMKTAQGQTSYELPPTRQGYGITALFEFSPSGAGGPFQKALALRGPTTSNSGGSTTVVTSSEDKNDGDYNDSVLTIVFQSL